MDKTLEKDMKKNLLEAEFNKQLNELDRLCERCEMMEEAETEAIERIHKGETEIHLKTRFIGSTFGKFFPVAGGYYYQINKRFFKELKTEHSKCRRKIKKQRKIMDKLKKKIERVEYNG